MLMLPPVVCRLARLEESRAFAMQPRRRAPDHVQAFLPVALSAALGALRGRCRRPDYAEGDAGE